MPATHAPTPRPPMPAAIDATRAAALRARQAIGVQPGQSVAITYGTYDLLHVGHVRLFERIKQRCDFLIVAVSSDRFNAGKGKTSVVPFADRFEMVRACRWVDHVIPEEAWDQKARDIAQFDVDLFVMGDDWSGRFDHLAEFCDVAYLPRTEGVSSTEIRRALRDGMPQGAAVDR